MALQIQRGDDLRRRLPLLRARERHGLSGWWLALALFVQPRCLFDQSKPRCLMNNPTATEPTARIYPGVATEIHATKRTRIQRRQAQNQPDLTNPPPPPRRRAVYPAAGDNVPGGHLRLPPCLRGADARVRPRSREKGRCHECSFLSLSRIILMRTKD